MRNLLTSLAVASAIGLFAQQNCAAHLGGSWFINCKSLVKYHGQDVVSFSDWMDPVGSVNLDVYSTHQVLEAQVRAGKLTKGDPKCFLLKQSATEFSLIDGSTDRIICILKKVPSTTKESACQVDVWLDLYVGGAGYFHCDPKSSNDPTMQMLRGATFANSYTAVTLQ